MTTTTRPMINLTSTLYEQDFYQWLKTTANLLKEKRFNEVDLENLIEEIEAMGRSERQAVKSNLIIVLMHLLKYQYQPEKQSNSWKSSIREHRRRLRESFKDSPSLYRFVQDIFSESYPDARELASDETGLPLLNFPELCPFSLAETLDPDFWPNGEGGGEN